MSKMTRAERVAWRTSLMEFPDFKVGNADLHRFLDALDEKDEMMDAALSLLDRCADIHHNDQLAYEKLIKEASE